MKRFVSPQHIDGLIHEPARLGIMSVLADGKSKAFLELRSLLNLTDGNLSAHAWALKKAGYIRIRKSFAGKKPKTDLRLTGRGGRALQKYLRNLRALTRA